MSRIFAFDVKQFEIAHLVDHGCAMMRQNRFAEAIVYFEAALRLDPSERYARWNRVLARLSLGDYVNGLPEHDCAWQLYAWHSVGNIDRILKLPLWRGIGRRRLIVYHEMGFGDAIMTLRFLPELVRRHESVTLLVRPELVRLMQGYGATIIDTVPEDLSQFDARLAFFNSIFTLGHSKETIPSAPYIPAQFNFTGGKMGIAWSGNSRREFSLVDFLNRIDTHGFEYCALQKSNDLHGVQNLDFKGTADLMCELDCIVTVDTAAAHLAGAIGHPNTHLILPYFRDWRWWNASTWYPTIKIYQQENPNNWSALFTRLNADLR